MDLQIALQNEVTCPCCKGTTTKLFHLFLADSRRLIYCRNCCIAFRYPRPTGKELLAIYTNAYSRQNIVAGTTRMAGTDEKLAEAYVRRLTHELNSSLTGKLIIDFGAGLGTVCKALIAVKSRPVAVDPFTYEYLRAEGIEAYVDLAEVPHQRVDGVIMIDVLEHLELPAQEIEKARKLLRPGGWIYISTCNLNCLRRFVVPRSWRDVHKAEHLVFFTFKGLRKILQTTGYDNVQRLRWRIAYHRGLRRIAHTAIQALGLDAELRVLAFRRG